MKTIPSIIALLLLTGAASAQTPGIPPSPGMASVTPGVTAPSPADSATVGRAPGVNPGNSQDLTHRSNPQDLTQQGGSNSQDSRPITPNVVVPR